MGLKEDIVEQIVFVFVDFSLQPGNLLWHASLNDARPELLRDCEADAGTGHGTDVAHEEACDSTKNRPGQDGQEGCARHRKRLETESKHK